MKILVVTEVFAPGLGGVPVFIERLANQLALAGDDVTVLTGTASWSLRSHEETLPSGVKVVRVPAIASILNTGNNRMSYNPWRTVRRTFAEFQPDCVHMHTPAGLLHKVALSLAKRHHVPVVVTNHVMPENLTMNLPRFLRSYATKKTRQTTIEFINQTDCLVTPTRTALGLLGDGVTIPTRTITNGIDTALYSPQSADTAVIKKLSIDLDYKTLLYTGRLDGEKRVDILIKAFAKVREKFTDLQLVIVGTGLLDQELHALARKSDVAAHCIFTGRISDEEKIELLRFATIFVMPSPAELQCISALEALSCSVPIVVADQAALTELVHEAKDGYSFSYPDVDDCARAIIELLQRPLTPSLLKKNGREWTLHNHDQAITVRQYQDTYRALL